MGEIPSQRSVGEINRLEATIDDYALYGRRFGAVPMQAVYNRRFGPEGMGWMPRVRDPYKIPSEQLAEIMELKIVEIMVTPQGDTLDTAQTLAQRM